MRIAAGIVFIACLLVGTIQADVVFTLGNHPQPGETNILLNGGSSGFKVTGTPNGLPTVVVDFSSTQSLLEPSNGQARVSDNPEGSPLNDLTISLEGGLTYGDLIMNPFIGGCRACTGGTATITVQAKDSMGNLEAPAVFTYTIANGNNFLTITTLNGEQIVSTNISGGSFDDLRQPRISGISGAAVPEPATYAPLMGLGLGVIALLRRRKA